MKVFKDGKAWTAQDSELGICVSGNTKEEALQNAREVEVVFSAIKANPKMKASVFGDNKKIKV